MSAPTSAIELHQADIPRAEALRPEAIVGEVNWRILTGDFWVIGGLPGSGKTDLLATAAALQKPLAGTHCLFGRDVQTMDEHELLQEKRRVGFVFGNGRLFTQSTIAENVALPICYHENCSYADAEPRVQEVLKLTGLDTIAEHRPREVTRNMHQRIGLARALALQPEVLLLDNPLLGVDPRLGRWWIDFLCSLATSGLHGRKLTLVVGTDDFRPWTDVGRSFGYIHERRWTPIGGREDLKTLKEPVLRELMS